MIYIANKKRKLDNIQKDYPGAYILDITSSSPYRYGQILSPFFPHGGIPIPGESRGMKATCVEAIWQGLKVFEHCGIDISMFSNDTMKNIKRTVRKYGKPRGHQFGVFSKTLLGYSEAKRLIYVPSYKYVLENIPEVHRILEKIKEQAKSTDIVLLDYNLNPDNRDASKPLSHAELVKMYLEGRYPEKAEDFKPYTQEELKQINSQSKSRKKTKTRDESFMANPDVKEEIITLLSSSSLSISEIKKLLSLNWNATRFKTYLLRIPGIKTNKVKKTVYYSLMEQKEESTLFDSMS